MIRLLLLGFALLLGPPALAQEGGHLPEDPHAEASAADAEHGGGDPHAYDWTGDDDHDGRANWVDPAAGTEDNEHYMVPLLGWHLINLLLFAAVVAWLAWRPLKDGLRGRAHDVRKELTDAARLRDEARQRHEELGARLSRFEEEVEALREEAAADAKREEKRLVERARREAERIQETSQRNIREETVRAQMALRAEAVGLAVELAESTLRNEVRSDDQKRLARQFLDSLKDGANGHGQP